MKRVSLVAVMWLSSMALAGCSKPAVAPALPPAVKGPLLSQVLEQRLGKATALFESACILSTDEVALLIIPATGHDALFVRVRFGGVETAPYSDLGYGGGRYFMGRVSEQRSVPDAVLEADAAPAAAPPPAGPSSEAIIMALAHRDGFYLADAALQFELGAERDKPDFLKGYPPPTLCAALVAAGGTS